MISKLSPNSFLFSVNEGRKYPITSKKREAIGCQASFCALFGVFELAILSDSNNNTDSWCASNKPSFEYGSSFKLPAAKGSQYPSMNGGEFSFQLKQFEVYSISVTITINNIFRNNEQWDRRRKEAILIYFHK
jgi:hypothetical protein